MLSSKINDIVFEVEPDRESNPWMLKWKTVFTSESGTVLSVPGFYDGGNRWITRFSAPEPGDWNYQVFSDWDKLNGKSGSITIGADELNEQEIEIDKKNPRRLNWSDGSDYFLLGFECDWLGLLDHEVEGIPKAELLMNSMEANGFNHVVMNVYARDTEWPWMEGRNTEHDYSNPPLWPFAGNWEKPDYSQLNPEFFHKLDQVIEGLQQRNIISHLMIYVWNKKVPWPNLGGVEDNTFFDYVISRYQAYSNIVWDISKEAILYGDCTDEFISERCRRVRSADAYNRLVTVHDRGYCERNPQMVDILSTQTWSTDLFGDMKDLAAEYHYKPVYNIEHGGYAVCPYNVFPGAYDDPEVCLDRNFQCVFAGVYSTYYWQGCSWSIVFPDMESLPDDVKPRLEFFRYMADFFREYPYNEYFILDSKTDSGGFWLQHISENRRLLYKPPGHYACYAGNGPDTPYKGSVPEHVIWFNTLTGEKMDMPFSPINDNEGHDENMGQWLEYRSPWGSGPAICVIEW